MKKEIKNKVVISKQMLDDIRDSLDCFDTMIKVLKGEWVWMDEHIETAGELIEYHNSFTECLKREMQAIASKYGDVKLKNISYDQQ